MYTRPYIIRSILAFNDQKKTKPFINQCDSKASFSSIKVPSTAGMTGFIGVSDDNGNEPIYCELLIFLEHVRIIN
jgi:hypothetical protein